MTCAQCHQMAGRDGVHVLLNDGLDRRITTSYNATEYVFRELDRQLRNLPQIERVEVGPDSVSNTSPQSRVQ